MTLGRLVFRNTVRRPVRMALTVAGLAMIVLAFGLIRLTLNQWTATATEANKNRLVTVHAMSETLKLPLAYRDRIAALPGVQSVHFGVWFGGIYQDPKQPLASFAEPPVTLLSTGRTVRVESRRCDSADGNRLSRSMGRRGPRDLPEHQCKSVFG
jgi:putative ABC transport system permease protein